jgi:hypothetical protein
MPSESKEVVAEKLYTIDHDELVPDNGMVAMEKILEAQEEERQAHDAARNINGFVRLKHALGNFFAYYGFVKRLKKSVVWPSLLNHTKKEMDAHYERLRAQVIRDVFQPMSAYIQQIGSDVEFLIPDDDESSNIFLEFYAGPHDHQHLIDTRVLYKIMGHFLQTSSYHVACLKFRNEFTRRWKPTAWPTIFTGPDARAAFPKIWEPYKGQYFWHHYLTTVSNAQVLTLGTDTKPPAHYPILHDPYINELSFDGVEMRSVWEVVSSKIDMHYLIGRHDIDFSVGIGQQSLLEYAETNQIPCKEQIRTVYHLNYTFVRGIVRVVLETMPQELQSLIVSCLYYPRS